MADRKGFLLRIDPELYDALQRWAADELRSVNGQIEFALRRALADAGRSGTARATPPPSEARDNHIDDDHPEDEWST